MIGLEQYSNSLEKVSYEGPETAEYYENLGVERSGDVIASQELEKSLFHTLFYVLAREVRHMIYDAQQKLSIPSLTIYHAHEIVLFM